MTATRKFVLLASLVLIGAPCASDARTGHDLQTSNALRESVVGSGVQRTPTSVLGFNVDQYVWTDSAGQTRTVSLKQEGNGNSGHGGYAVQMTYQVLESGVWRTVTVNASTEGDGGFGYFVAHELYRNFDNGDNDTIASLHGQDDSPLGLGFPVTTSYSTIYPNTTTATETFHLTYPKWGTVTPIADPADDTTPAAFSDHQLFQVPITIVWTFQSGTDFPRIDYVVDISAAKKGQLAFDMRGPYGVMEFADNDTNATINNVQWGDSAFHFNSSVATSGFLQQNSSWKWSTAIGGSRPYHAMIAKHSTTSVLYEMGLFEMKLNGDNGLTYSGYADHRGLNGTGFYAAANGIQQYEWPFQSAQYSGSGGDGGWLPNTPIYGKKFAWGSAPLYGSGLTTVYLNDNTPAAINPFPNGGVITYRTCWVAGKSTYSGVGTASLTRGIAASSTPSCAIGQPDGQVVPPPPPPPPAAPGFVSLVPARVLDTRAGQSTSDGSFAGGGPIAALGSLDLSLLGRGGVPGSGVSAVVLNVTATDPVSAGYITVWPTGSARPLASNLNFTPAQTIANLLIAKLGTNGRISLFNSSGSTDLIADVQGYFTSTSDLTAIAPVRLLDTRTGQATIDGSYAGTGAVPASGELDLTVLNRAGIPASGVSAVVLNVTATDPTAAGYLTVWPTGSATPFASNLNFTPGETIANLVTAKVGPTGQVAFFNSSGSTDIIADAVGYFASTTDLTALVPSRVLDTRPGQVTSDGLFEGSGPIVSGTPFNFTVLGRGGVPASGVGAVVLNITTTNPTTASYLTVWPSGSPMPLASNLNYVPGETIPNLVIAKVGSNGQVALYNGLGATDVVADVVGWFSGTP
jgi:hypothetical protein